MYLWVKVIYAYFATGDIRNMYNGNSIDEEVRNP